MLEVLRTEPATPTVRRGTLAARAVRSDEAGLAASLLRRDFAWRSVGLGAPPDREWLARPASVTRPRPRELWVDAVWLWWGDAVAGLGVAYGWDSQEDRVRVAELVKSSAGTQEPKKNQEVGEILVAWMRLCGRAHAVRAAGEGHLAAALGGTAGAQKFDIQGAAWLHLPHDLVEAMGPLAVVSPEPQELSGADRRVLSALAAARVAPATRSLDIMVRDPSAAHWQLLLGAWPQRRFVFRRAPRAEETDVVVVGGGLSGLAAAYALRPKRCIVLERDDRLGGTGAAYRGLRGAFPLAAHYECEPDESFGKDIVDVYQDLGVLRQEGGRYAFVDAQHYVPEDLSEQAVLPDGTLRRDGWQLFYRDAVAMRLREQLLPLFGAYPLPSRLAKAGSRAENNRTFRAWLDAHGMPRGDELERSMNVLLRSDYAAGADAISAFAGLHYFLCRPYLTTGTRTFSPPEGLMYFGNRLVAATPDLSVRTEHMVRRVRVRGDRVEVLALDLRENLVRRFRCRGVVYAAPKKALPYVYPRDRRLFARNSYAAWITLTMELSDLPERDLLCWANHVHEPSGRYVGFTWVNRAEPQAPPVLTHYLALGAGRAAHLRALTWSPQALAAFCLRQLAAVVGRDVSGEVERITIQKLGHAMPVPVPGSLFIDPNAHRSHKRVVYAGVDTGRLPLLAEAIDSGLEAAAALGGVVG